MFVISISKLDACLLDFAWVGHGTYPHQQPTKLTRATSNPTLPIDTVRTGRTVATPQPTPSATPSSHIRDQALPRHTPCRTLTDVSQPVPQSNTASNTTSDTPQQILRSGTATDTPCDTSQRAPRSSITSDTLPSNLTRFRWPTPRLEVRTPTAKLLRKQPTNQPTTHTTAYMTPRPKPVATQGPQWTQQLREPIAQNPWQPKDHNGHNSLENPSPKTPGQPRTTMDTTA